MENLSINGLFNGTPTLGNLHMRYKMLLWQCHMAMGENDWPTESGEQSSEGGQWCASTGATFSRLL